MRCPECNAANQEGAASCSSCGLILFKLAAPNRRRDDMAQTKRRRADAEETNCRFCNGVIKADAVRCQHCAQILNEDVLRQVLKRRRAHINYASWVAYIMGLLVFLIFRPVGILAIGAGLMLSIVYYAIPVEPDPDKRLTLKERIRKQFTFERVAIPLPAMGSKKFVFIGTPILAAVAGFMANYFVLQRPINQIIDQNAAFRGMRVSAHYEYWVIPGVLVYDLRELDEGMDPLHVHTALLQFASSRRDSMFKRVELHYRGQKRLWMDGTTFRRIGEEYEKKNFRFALFDFTKMLHPDSPGQKLSKSGGNDALVQFHKVWYANDELARLSAQQRRAAQQQKVLPSRT